MERTPSLLLALVMIFALVAEGHETQYGLYSNTVNGVTADCAHDQTCWAFYMNGEYAATGIDATAISADTAYGES